MIANILQLYSLNLAQKAKELRMEQKKSDAILFQMLPTSVAIKLKQTHQVPKSSIFMNFDIFISNVYFRFLLSFLSLSQFISRILLALLKLHPTARLLKCVHSSTQSIKFLMHALSAMMFIKLKLLAMHTW